MWYFDNLGRVIQSLGSVWVAFTGEVSAYGMLVVLVWLIVLLGYLVIPVMLYLLILFGGHRVLKHYRYDSAAQNWANTVGFPILLIAGIWRGIISLVEALIRLVVWIIQTPARNKARVELWEIFMINLSRESVAKTQGHVDGELHKLAQELDQCFRRSRAIQTFQPGNPEEQSAYDREKTRLTVELPAAQTAFWRAYDVAEKCGYQMKELHPAKRKRSHKAYLTAEELLISHHIEYFVPSLT